jgi:hypothetical protein
MKVLAVAVKGNGGGAPLSLVEWDDFDYAARHQLPDPDSA